MQATTSDYNLEELKIALDPGNPKHILPPPVPRWMKVLDLGCGAGQSLIGAYPDRLTFGIDIDLRALALGKTLSDTVCFCNAAAEALPFSDGQFDLVFARVSLPYTNIAVSVKEMRRVLKRGGTVWLSLHPFSLAWKQAKAANYKGRIFFAYIVLNSLALHFFGRQVRFRGRCESFQTTNGITRLLDENGFENILVTRGEHFVATASVR